MVAQKNRAGNEAAEENGRRREEAPAPRIQLQPAAEAQTRFMPFRCAEDFHTISTTTALLETSGFYWGAITQWQAAAMLKNQSVGTYLVRDSSQRDTFFTLSYNTHLQGPINARIRFKGNQFSLAGNHECFVSLFQLLEHYVTKGLLSKPLRKEKVQSLQALCRQRIIQTCGGEQIHKLPLNPVLKDYLRSFPYRL